MKARVKQDEEVINDKNDFILTLENEKLCDRMKSEKDDDDTNMMENKMAR